MIWERETEERDRERQHKKRSCRLLWSSLNHTQSHTCHGLLIWTGRVRPTLKGRRGRLSLFRGVSENFKYFEATLRGEENNWVNSGRAGRKIFHYIYFYTIRSKRLITYLLKRDILSHLGKNWERNKRKKKGVWRGCEWGSVRYEKGSTLCSLCSLPTSDLAFSFSQVWGGEGVRPVVSDNGFVEERELCSENVQWESFTVGIYHLLQRQVLLQQYFSGPSHSAAMACGHCWFLKTPHGIQYHFWMVCF